MYPLYLINEKDDDRRGAFKNAQKTIGGIMREKERCMEGDKRKQQVTVMDELLKSSTKQSVESPVIVSKSCGRGP